MITEDKQNDEVSAVQLEPHFLGAKDLLRLSFRVFRTKPLRTFLTILGMSLGVGIVLALTSLGYGLQYLLIGKLVTTEDSLLTLDAYYAPEGGLKIMPADVESVRTFDGAAEVSPLAEFPAEVSLPDAPEVPSGFLLSRIVDSSYSRLSGIVPELTAKNFDKLPDTAIVSANALKILSLPEDETTLNKKLSVKVFYPLESSDVINENVEQAVVAELKTPVVIRGILTDPTLPPFVLVPSEQVTAYPPYYERLFIKALDEDKIENLREQLIGSGFLVSSRIDLVKQIKKITSIATLVLGVFGVTALVVSAIGMFNTMLISFLERIYEVGIMKAIGATDRDIKNLFLMESLIMGFMGGLGGIFTGALIGEVTNLALNLLARNFGGQPVDLFVRPWWFMFLIVFLSSIIGLLSGFWPARRATTVSPKEAFLRK